MKYKKLVAVAVLSLMATPTLAAKIDMAPGLWDIKVQFDDNSGVGKMLAEIERQLAALPEEQRTAMKAMLGSQTPKALTTQQTQVCITKEQIAQGQLPKSKNDCDQTIVEVGKGHYQVSMSCPESQGGAKGTGDMLFSSPKSFKGNVQMSGSVQGMEQEIKLSQEGQWVSADCGDIKPYDAD